MSLLECVVLPTPPDADRLGRVPACASEADIRRVTVGTSQEPLVGPPAELVSLRPYFEAGIALAPEHMLLRESVVARLLAAQAQLPAGYSLVLLDGWRPLAFQRELLAHYLRLHGSLDEGFVADPDSRDVVPPHVTGGAIDLTLGYHGVPLGLGTDFDDFTPAANLQAFEAAGADATVRSLRRLLADVLTRQGLAPYPLEWWHWTYGDQRWAAQYGHPVSLYGAAESVSGLPHSERR